MQPNNHKIRTTADRIIKISLRRVPLRYTDTYGRWVWVSGFLASWLARIAVTDITVRQQLEALEEDTENIKDR